MDKDLIFLNSRRLLRVWKQPRRGEDLKKQILHDLSIGMNIWICHCSLCWLLVLGFSLVSFHSLWSLNKMWSLLCHTFSTLHLHRHRSFPYNLHALRLHHLRSCLLHYLHLIPCGFPNLLHTHLCPLQRKASGPLLQRMQPRSMGITITRIHLKIWHPRRRRNLTRGRKLAWYLWELLPSCKFLWWHSCWSGEDKL